MKMTLGSYRTTRVAVLRALSCALLWAIPANAVTITNVTTATVLFSDDFETGSFSPAVGAWTIIGPSVSVTNSTVPPDPGPAQGSFYARLFRDTGTINSQGNLRAALSTTQSTPGDVIRLRTMVYLPDDGVAFRAQIMLDDLDFNTARAWVAPDGAGHVLAVGPSFVQTDTGLHYTPNAWQEWDLEYAIGASTFSVSVNGHTASGFSSFTSGQLSDANLFNGDFSAGSFYLDAAVPEAGEPASAAVSACALSLIALFRRRST
jgi:hypothetical protein